MSPRTRISVRDQALDIYSGNAELPALVLLPGLFGGGWIWEPVAAILSDAGYQVAVPVEPMGCHPEVADVDRLTHAVGAVIAEVFDRPVVLAGNSLGALVSLKLVAAREIPVCGLVLSGSPGLGEAVRPPAVGSLRSVSKNFAQQQAGLLFYDKSLVTPELVDRCFDACSAPKTKLRIVRALRNTRGFDARHLFGKTECPTLLLWGAQDEISPPEQWAAAASLFTAASFVAIDDAGHSPMIERPEATATAIMRFLTDTVLECTMDTAQPRDIETTVRTLIADYTHRPITHITDDRALDDLGLDSLGTVELILACEDALGIGVITDEDMDIRTVGQAITFVRGCLGHTDRVTR